MSLISAMALDRAETEKDDTHLTMLSIDMAF